MDEVEAIDLSCEDYAFLNSSSDGFLHHHFSEHEQADRSFELLENVDAMTLGKTADTRGSEVLPQPSECLEPQKLRKNGKCNLRKSLAWDSAFFTSAGFLEPEELSSMLEGVDMGGKKLLPGIQEDDIHRSIDSISTLESDSLTLDSLEADLFHDIRASIQRSSKASSAANLSNQAASAEKAVPTNQCKYAIPSMIEGADKGGKKSLPGIQEDDIQRSIDSISTLESDSLTLESLEADLFQDIRASIQRSSKASSAANISNKIGSAEKAVQANQSSRKAGIASQNKVKSMLTSKRPSISTQGSVKIMKESSNCQQLTQAVARGGESALVLPKLPKVLGKACPMSTAASKRASLGANRVKVEKDNSKRSTVADRGAPSSRTPGLGGSRSGVPRPTQSLRFSSSGPSNATKTEPRTSCSSLDSSSSVSSKSVGKSPSNSVKRIPDSKAIKPPSSGLNNVSRSKPQQGNSHLSSYVKSATKLSSSISPASSISEWSCESSSSTSTTQQRFSGAKAIIGPSSPCKGVSVDSDSPHAQNSLYQSNGQFSVGHEIQATGLQSQCANEAVMGSGASACPVSAKPSGLRMPSPKIGFFDGVKSVVRTPKGGMQSNSGVPSSLRNSGPSSSSPSGGPSNSKSRNVQPAITFTAIRNIKPDSQQATSTRSTSLILLKEPSSNASIKVSSATRAVRNFPGSSPKVQNVKSKTAGKTRTKTEEEGASGPDRAKDDLDPYLKSKMTSEIKECVQSKNIEITPVDGDGLNATCNLSSSFAVAMTISSHEEIDNAPNGQNCLKNDLCSFRNTVVDFKKQMDGVRGYNGAMNLNDEMQKELEEISVSQSVTCPKEVRACGQIGESFNILLNSASLSLSPVTSELTAGTRIPFAVKNSLSDRDELFESSKGLIPEVVEKTATLLCLEGVQKENN